MIRKIAILGLMLLCATKAFAAPPMVTEFGGLKLGDSGKAAVDLFGEPTTVSGEFQLPKNIAPWAGVIYRFSEHTALILTVCKVTPFEAEMIGISVTGKPDDKVKNFTIGGIGLGAPEAALREKFGEPDREIVREEAGQRTLAYNSSNVVFSVEKGVVNSISITYRNSMMADALINKKKMKPDEAWMEIGDLRVRGKQIELAREAYEEVLKLNPKNTEAHLRLGSIWFELGETEKAEKFYKTVIAADPQNTVACYNLGRLYVAAKNKPEARKYLNRAIAGDPMHAAAFNELGLLDEMDNKLADAERNFKRSSELAPDLSAPLQNLARVQLRKGNKQSAIDTYSKALTVELKRPDTNQQTVRDIRKILAELREQKTAPSAKSGS